MDFFGGAVGLARRLGAVPPLSEDNSADSRIPAFRIEADGALVDERDVLADARRDAHDRAGVGCAAVAFAGHTVIFHQTPL